MISAKQTGFIALLLSALGSDCVADQTPQENANGAVDDAGGNDATPPTADGSDGGASIPPSPVEAVPLTETIRAPSLSAPVDIVRDEWGIPHVYGETLAAVTFGQGYTVARDRFVPM